MKEKKENQTVEAEVSEEVPEEVSEEVPAEEAAQVPCEEAPDPVAEWKAKAEAAQSEAADFKRKWYSVTAEYDNYRKRTASTRTQAYAEGRADVVCKLFPIADNLERALKSCADEGTRKGIEMVTASFNKILEEEKIEVIDPLGEAFDAEKCEAIMALDPEEGEESGMVKQVYLKGYEQNGKVLRFAQVVVTK